MDDWSEGLIGNFFDLENGFAFKSADFISEGIPVIKIKNVKAGYFSEHDFSYVPLGFLDKRPDKVARWDDLLISMSGNRHDGSPETWVGKIALFRKDSDFLINQRVGALRAKTAVEFDIRFASYLLSSFPYQELFISIATSSGGQANLSPAQILKAPIRYPDLPTQKAIGEILGALDDKIDLNRRMNETLEQTARVLFQDWFVDFGPTKAKLAGQAAYLGADLWDLFPARLDEAGVPEGWESQSLSGFFSIIGGGTPKTSVSEYWGGNIPWFSVVDTPPGGSVFVFETEKSITELGLNESAARLVPAGTTIISARGTVGNLAVAAQPMTFNQSCYALRGKNNVGDYFTYFVAQLMVVRLQGMAHGSVFSTITRQTFEAISMPKPNAPMLSAFERVVAGLLDKVRSNVAESITLAQTRDLLLPKLMSGELRVRDAAALVAEQV